MVMVLIEALAMRGAASGREPGLRFGHAEAEIHVRHQYGDVRYKAEVSL